MSPRTLWNFGIGLLLCLWTSVSYAGSIALEVGGNYLLDAPKGGFMEELQLQEDGTGAHIGLRYIFDFGLLVGRESLTAVYPYENPFEEEKSKQQGKLVISSEYYVLGFAFGEDIRSILEAGFREKSIVSTRKRVYSQTIHGSQMAQSQGFGFALDLGGDGFGLVIRLRSLAFIAEDLFASGKSFEFYTRSVGLGVRYQW